MRALGLGNMIIILHWRLKNFKKLRSPLLMAILGDGMTEDMAICFEHVRRISRESYAELL